MKSNVLLCLLVIVIIVFSSNLPTYAHAQLPQLTFLINKETFVSGDVLVVFGKTIPNDILAIRIFDPAGKAIRIESVFADNNGSFTAQIFTWPDPSRNFVFGKYVIEAASSTFPENKETREVSYSDEETISAPSIPSSGNALSVKLDSPTEISVNKPFRIFVQVTFNGALVNVDNPDDMLKSSHVHLGNSTINLSGKFNKLHEGIYYADVQLDTSGSYIIHAIAFYRGFLAHDSKVISSGSSIGEIQESVDTLKLELDRTSRELNATRQAVDDAREAIKRDIETATGSVSQLENASGQINSLILPILALISIIIALQISLFARIRASFK